jgi:hypothetical protein
MPHAVLPDTASIALAAALAGCPRAAFKKQYVEAGLVEVSRPAGGRVVVVLASLEKAIGRPISAEEYLAANHRLTPQRAYQTEYRRRHRKPGDKHDAQLS